jgi:hypothetical protein
MRTGCNLRGFLGQELVEVHPGRFLGLPNLLPERGF